MSEFQRQAANLLGKACDDLIAATCLSKDPEVSRRAIGFHAQQAVEKALKAVLMRRETQYPLTHDIKALIKLVEKAAAPPPPNARDLSRLTPFATILRYENEEWDMPEPVDVDGMLGYAETTVAWAREILGSDV